MKDDHAKSPPDPSEPRSLPERIVTAALAWYQAQVSFSSVQQNRELGQDVGAAEQELRALCRRYRVLQRCDIDSDPENPLEANRRSLLLGPPNERPASFYSRGGSGE